MAPNVVDCPQNNNYFNREVCYLNQKDEEDTEEEEEKKQGSIRKALRKPGREKDEEENRQWMTRRSKSWRWKRGKEEIIVGVEYDTAVYLMLGAMRFCG